MRLTRLCAPEHGGRTPDEVIAYVADLKKRGRYQTHLY